MSKCRTELAENPGPKAALNPTPYKPKHCVDVLERTSNFQHHAAQETLARSEFGREFPQGLKGSISIRYKEGILIRV